MKSQWAFSKRMGFTIVELLIVIVVIAVLAVVTIVAYNGMQSRAQASALQSDLANAKKKLSLYKVDQGHFPTSFAELTSSDVKATKSAYDTTANNFYYCLNTSTDEFGLGGRTLDKKSAYVISSSGSLQSYPGGVGADQVCQAVGLTGYADANAYVSNGHASGSGWASWVK